ncbi:MAG TPA: hypothetical protein DCF48_06705 [Rikenellaceae bacterium]|nr:hypothetical protein [Rikenellaceae bacterium]
MSRSKILLFASLAFVAACSGKEKLPEEKIPLQVEASLSGQVQTKASAGDFAEGDKILVYLRHMNGTTPVTVDRAPLLAGFTMDADKKPVPDTPLYWDDFSSNKEDGLDIREAGHGLEAYYAYCYNGGTPVSSLDEATGELEWKVGDQTSALAVQQTDLLWARPQHVIPVRGTINLPFWHAMSEVSVTLILDSSFDNVTEPLKKTVLTLNGIHTEVTFIASYAYYSSSTPKAVKMYGDGAEYVAIVAPGTPLEKGARFLDITDVDGNNYTLDITDAILEGWYKQDPDRAEPGVNYHLNITLSKAAVKVQATLADWVTVDADGTGKIQFPDDVVDLTVTAGTFENGTSFDLYRYETTPGEKSATVTYDGSKWVSDPLLYWPNQSTNYYFRAVMDGTDDTLWATTPAHNGFEEGAAIAPRTGNVPLAFEHVKSQLSVELETSTTASAVNLEGATIAIGNLATEGTLNVADGAITPGALVEDAIPAATVISDKIVIPQTIGNASVMTITLADGTTYKLPLNQCLDSTDTAITEWERGKSYTYTIHLELEEVSYRALVKDWTVVTGSGNANLEWD